jgi:hypothetical protein
MKNYISSALCALFLLSLSCCKNNDVKVVLSPHIEECNDSNLTVDKVILTDSMTIIDCSYKMSNINGGYIYLGPNPSITVNGKRYNLIGTKNIPTANVCAELIHYRTVTFSMIFPAIPSNAEFIDFSESNDNNGWIIKGISLTSKAKSISYADKEANDRYVKKIKDLEAQYSDENNDTYNSEQNDSYGSSDSETSGSGYQDQLHYFYCCNCGTLVQAPLSSQPSPNSGKCTHAYHNWSDLGIVGSNHTYYCDRCGLSIVCDHPNNVNSCVDHTDHHWIQRN